MPGERECVVGTLRAHVQCIVVGVKVAHVENSAKSSNTFSSSTTQHIVCIFAACLLLHIIACVDSYNILNIFQESQLPMIKTSEAQSVDGQGTSL